MTVSGSVTGSTDGTSNNLQTNDETSFALYLATVVSNLTVLDKVHFDLVTPMNEPTAAWWVYGGSQEGCHMSADQQARVVNDLSSALAVQSPGTGIDASEDNDEQDTIDSIDAYGAAQDHVTRIATHTYGANDPFGILDLSAGLQTPAWVSEYGDGDASGITMARRVHDDITDMWVSGWIYWQVVDNAGGWGFLSNPLNGSGDTAYTVNEKFYVMAQFSRYIRPGYEILNVSDDYSLAAYNPTNQSLVIVAVNDGSTNLTLNYNLGAFARLPSQVAVLQTSPSSSLAVQPSLAVTNGGFSVTLIPQSVTTFQLNSVVPPATADTRQAWYMLEGNANDSSGNGQNGTVFGSTYVPGKLGAFAAQFNGTSSDIQIPLSISNSFTIAYWLKTTDTGGGPQWWAGKGLVDGEVPGTTNDFGTSLVGGSAALGVGNPDTTIATTNAVNDGQWHHIAATRDATTGQMLIYVDGVLQASGLGPVGTRGAPPALRVGSIQAGYAGGFYTGAIDDVQLFDNVVPAAQIPSLMNHPPFFTNAPGYFSGGEWQWSEPDPSTFATNFNVLAGNVLTVTNFASDPDLPAQTLNWSLLSAPAGANINATNGILSWRPAIAQSPSTNFVTVQVSDNGTPVMSASQTLNVVIQEPPSPQFGTTVVSNEVLFLPVSGDSGPDYVLETTTNLADNTSWTPLATNLSASPPFLWSDPITSAYREKFYRVRLAP
jgi:O-glycosyl hydrolase